MTKFLPRTGINSPRLVRLLAGLDVAEVPESKQSFAERLGHWLDLGDAIALSGALSGTAAAGERAAVTAGPPAAAVEHVRTLLAAAIDAGCASGAGQPGRSRIRLPQPAADATRESMADFLPYRRYYLAQQRDMEAAIGPLRADARRRLAATSAAGARLAALDATMDKALAERERLQLAAVPFLLEKHYGRLRQRGPQAPADDPAQWMQPGGWLAVFCSDLRTVLLAELELRLQPVLGLVEAAGSGCPPAVPPRAGRESAAAPIVS